MLFMARILEWVAISSSNRHVLSELFTMTCLSRVALHGMAHSLIELHEPFCHHKAVIHEGELEITQPVSLNDI